MGEERIRRVSAGRLHRNGLTAQTGLVKSFVHDSAVWRDGCHLKIYGSVRLKSIFEGSLELITWRN